MTSQPFFRLFTMAFIKCKLCWKYNLFQSSRNLSLRLNNVRQLLKSVTLLDDEEEVFGLEDNSKVNPKLDNLHFMSYLKAGTDIYSKNRQIYHINQWSENLSIGVLFWSSMRIKN